MRTSIACLAAALAAFPAVAADPPAPQKLDPALVKMAGESADKAIAYFRGIQDSTGSLAPGDKFDMGITGIATTAMLRTGRITPSDPLISKALAHLETFVQPDGGIYPKALDGQQNYLTSIGLMAFVEANKGGRYKSVVDNAVKYLKGLQWMEPKVGPDHIKYGGFGYGGKQRPDLSNTSFTLEALKSAGVPKDDPAVQRAVTFLTRCQNFNGEGGNDKAVNKGADLDGGFTYTPDDSMAGKTPSGGLRSYASMTYAGLKSFIYAGLKKDDPRLQAALEWIRKHYSLTENPGLGKAGLYYYYQTFCKALDAAEHERIDHGVRSNWRAEVVKELLGRQASDGSWSNEEKRWLENDKRLATAYALLALAAAAK